MKGRAREGENKENERAGWSTENDEIFKETKKRQTERRSRGGSYQTEINSPLSDHLPALQHAQRANQTVCNSDFSLFRNSRLHLSIII